MQQQSRNRKILREGTYVIQLANGEQHYVQAAAVPQQYQQQHIQIQSHHLQQQQQQHQQHQAQPQPQAVIQPDTFQEVITFVQQLYRELAKEKHFTHFSCLFCSHEYIDLKSLIRHITECHRIQILDGTYNLEQDFEDIIRNKIIAREEKQAAMSADNQLYQCVQCQQMFNSLAVITEHLNHCTPPQEPEPYELKVEVAPEIETVPEITHPVVQPYIPYGCAGCGNRFHTIRELTRHIVSCAGNTFWDAEKHLLPEYRVDAPENQHIVINEDSTNVTLKTTGLWQMAVPPEHKDASDALRGFWVMPSATSAFGDAIASPHPPPMVPLQTTAPVSKTAVMVAAPSALQLTQQQHAAPAPGTLIVLPNDGQQLMTTTDGLSCIQANDGSYHVINSVTDVVQQRHRPANTTTVIAHAPPTDNSVNARGKKRGRTTKNDYGEVVTANTSYATANVTVATPVPKSEIKRKRVATYVPQQTQPQHQTLQATFVPETNAEPQQFYLAYDQNGVLVPVDNPNAVLTADGSMTDVNVVNIGEEQFIIQNVEEEEEIEPTTVDTLNHHHHHHHHHQQHQQQQHHEQCPSSSSDVLMDNGGTGANDSTYNIDDLSHLDKPIPLKPDVPPITPAKSKPQFMDSFFTFLMNRETNKL